MLTAVMEHTQHTAIDASDEAAISFLRQLVATESLSGDEDWAVRLFTREAERLGLETAVDEAGNGIATRRGDGEGEIILLGHIDTVPGTIPVRLEDGVLHGRGAVDAKGPLAAMLYSAARADISRFARVHVVAAVGEEADSPGARHLAETMRPDLCIVGEPSGWEGVTLGYKGSLRLRAEVERACGHSAGPDGSACDALLAWWSDVLRRIESLNDGRTGAFERVQASAAQLESDSDGLRDHAAMTSRFRLPTWIEPEELERVIRDAPGIGIEIRALGSERAYRVERSDAVVRALSGAIRATGGRPRHIVKTGTADLNVVGPAWDCPIAAYGPGDSALDHTPNERIELAEYARSIDVISRALSILGAEGSVIRTGEPLIEDA